MSKGRHGKSSSWNEIDETTSVDTATNIEMLKERDVKASNVDIDDDDFCFFADYPNSKSLSASHTIGKVIGSKGTMYPVLHTARSQSI